MRFVGHGVVGVVAFFLGLAVGYLVWGMQARQLVAEVRNARVDCDQRVAAMEQRAKTAEEGLRQEAKLRKVFEDKVEEVSPQK
jgi:proteasome assembly chaperone (PAC2) family protein